MPTVLPWLRGIELQSSRSRRLRFSIRWKLLLLLSGVLLVAVGACLRLATGLFREDKLVYVFDLQGAVVGGLAEQSRTRLSTVEAEVTRVAQALERGVEPSSLFQPLFAIEPDLLQIQVFRPVAGAKDFELAFAEVSKTALAEVQVSEKVLERHLVHSDLPIAAVATSGQVYIDNSSIMPDLPLLVMLAPFQSRSGVGVVVATWRHQQLLGLFATSTANETALINSHGEVLAHGNSEKVVTKADLSTNPLIARVLESPTQVSRGVIEVGEGRAAELGAYAAVDIGGLRVVSRTSKEAALRASDELVRRSTYIGLAILAGAFVISIFFTRLITAPIRRLREATMEIGAGNFDAPIEASSNDEIGELAEDFRAMTAALKQTESQLIQSEKLAAFGQLGAGITHEVKGPLTGIIGLAQAAKMSVSEPDAVEMLELIEKEGKRCTDILSSFLRFARREGRALSAVDLNELVTSASALFRHQLNVNNVTLKLDLDDSRPLIVAANPSELQQVLTNLAINAQHAMPRGGTLSLSTRWRDGVVMLEVADTGEGMSADVRARVFEPFFTTKPAGEGTGLGLSVSYGIIRDHGGTITIDSEPGSGARFTIELPEHRS